MSMLHHSSAVIELFYDLNGFTLGGLDFVSRSVYIDALLTQPVDRLLHFDCYDLWLAIKQLDESLESLNP